MATATTHSLAIAGEASTLGTLTATSLSASGGEISGVTAGANRWWKLGKFSSNSQHMTFDVNGAAAGTASMSRFIVSVAQRSWTFVEYSMMNTVIAQAPRVVAMLDGYTQPAFPDLGSSAQGLTCDATPVAWQSQIFKVGGTGWALSSVRLYPYYNANRPWRPTYYFEVRKYNGAGTEGTGQLLSTSRLYETPSVTSYDAAVGVVYYLRPAPTLSANTWYEIYFPDSGHIGFAGAPAIAGDGNCLSPTRTAADGLTMRYNVTSAAPSSLYFTMYIRTGDDPAYFRTLYDNYTSTLIDEGDGLWPTSYDNGFIYRDSGDIYNEAPAVFVPRRYLEGWVMTFDSDTVISAGSAIEYDSGGCASGRSNMQYRIVIKCDIATADPRGYYTGVPAESTWYGVYVFERGTYGSPSTAPVFLSILPAGTYAKGSEGRRVGWVKTTAAPITLMRTTTIGKETTRKVMYTADLSLTRVLAGGAVGTGSVSLAAYVPPDTPVAMVRVTFAMDGNAGSVVYLVPSGTAFGNDAANPYDLTYKGTGTAGTITIPLDSTLTVAWTLVAGTGANTPTINIDVVGYVDCL